MILLLFMLGIFQQDSIVYHYKDSVVGKTIIDGSWYYYYDGKDSLKFTTEKLDNVWYYYRSDTIFQRLEFGPEGHCMYWLEDGIWVEGVKATYYSIATYYEIKPKQDVFISSNNKRVQIRGDTQLKIVEVYDMSGKMIRSLNPYSNRVILQFSNEELVIIKVNGESHKVLIK